MEPIELSVLGPRLEALSGQQWYLHLETTAGAYTAGGFGAYIRNARIDVRRAGLQGSGPFRAGVETADGWVYAEGLTHWEADAEGRLLMAGYDGEGRVTVVCEFAARPFAMVPQARRISPPVAVDRAGGTAPPSPERAVLAVLAHPDDETFGCGGTLAAYAQGGVPVTLACLTRGEMGRNMGKPAFATRETLPDLRVGELTAACAALGVADLRLLAVWDKTSEFRDPDALAEQVSELLRELRPSLVITQHPVHGGHPDHCAAGAAAIAAVRRLPEGERPRLECMVHPRVAEAEHLTLREIDISGAPAEAKMAATRAHRSQSEAMLQRLQTDPEEAERRRRWMQVERWLEYPV